MTNILIIPSIAFGKLIKKRQPCNNLGDPSGYFHSRDGYDDFLEEIITLEKFIPCKKGIPLNKPTFYSDEELLDNCIEGQDYFLEYEDALDKCIFADITFSYKAKVLRIYQKDSLILSVTDNELPERSMESIIDWNLSLKHSKAIDIELITN